MYIYLENFPSIDPPKDIKEKEKSSIQNVPVCDDENILNNLHNHSEIEALVFKAKIILKEPDSLNREFVVKYFLNDQSFSVSEMKIQMAGNIIL